MTSEQGNESARLEVLDTGRSFHVESPAGSGKTTILTTRFLRLLGVVDRPGEVLALTYTDKAAGEMRARIVEALQKAKKGAEPTGEAEARLLEAAAEALHRHGDRVDLAATPQALNIMTFHGFCFYLAARAPLEAGMAPGFAIADETAQKRMAAESAARTIERLKGLTGEDSRHRALENRALHRDNNWKMLTEELADIIMRRDRFFDLVNTISRAGSTDLSLLEKAMRERLGFYVEKHLEKLREAFSKSDIGKSWVGLVRDLEDHKATVATNLPEEIPGVGWKDLATWKTMSDCLLTKGGDPRKSLGPKTGFYKGYSNSIWASLIKDMPPQVVELLKKTRNLPTEEEPITDMDVLADLILLGAEAIRDYNRMCTARSVVDFVGIEQCALRVLGSSEPTEMLLHLDHRLTHILVDEFQDINRTQWELLQKLVSGWEPGDGRTVFIVGDPKQSIYAFRNAEVSLFFEAKEGIPRPGYGPLVPESRTLQTNFRSGAALVNWVNDLFGRTVMADPDFDADEVPFRPSVAGSEDEDEGKASLALFGDEDGEKALEREAAWMASLVEREMAETGGSRSIGILLFTRKRLSRYLAALRERNVPVQVQEGLQLAKRPEAQHMLILARLLACPHDDLAWASLLRSPWSWCGLSTLVEASLAPGTAWIDKLRGLAPKGGDIGRIVGELDKALARIGRDTTGSVTRKLWEALDGPARTAAMYGTRGVANCIHICKLIDELDEGTPQETLSSLESVLDYLYEKPDPATSRSPVQLMTIHRAKGLEFDVVFLPFLDWEPRSGNDEPYLLERVPGAGGEHLIAMKKDRRAEGHDPLYRLLSRFRKDRSLGEAKRWFYVAVTRARSRLYMSGVADVKDGLLVPPSRSPLKWIFQHEGLWGLPHLSDAGTLGSETNALSLTVNPAPATSSRESDSETAQMERNIPEPLEIKPERPEITVTTPTSPSIEPQEPTFYESTSSSSNEAERNDNACSIAALRGTFIHRLLKRYVERKEFPFPEAVATALIKEGLPKKEADRLAGEILGEAVTTVRSPFISGLLKGSEKRIISEWKLERSLSASSVVSGTVDLAVFDGSTWWIIDFKTGTPGISQDIDDFMSEEMERYREQLAGYARLLEDSLGVETQDIRFGIFFTSLGLWQELSSP